jgi:uncharacterized protein YeaO (DUF488 family)
MDPTTGFLFNELSPPASTVDRHMPAIRTKCVWTEIEPEKDGLRLLVTRYTLHRCPKTRYDAWMPNLAPSEPLLHDWLGKRILWKEFASRYKKELFAETVMDKDNKRIKNYGQKFTLRFLRVLASRQPVTLLCSCPEDEDCCHRHLLKALVESAK